MYSSINTFVFKSLDNLSNEKLSQYEKNLSKELFKNPTCEYRATPFWAWNCYMTKQMVYEQSMEFKKMGICCREQSINIRCFLQKGHKR